MVHQLGEWGVTEMFFLPRVDFADLMNEFGHFSVRLIHKYLFFERCPIHRSDILRADKNSDIEAT